MNAIQTGIRANFLALVDGVERGDDLPSLQKKQRAILMLSEMVRQLNALEQERMRSIRTLESLDIQNTLTTLGTLLKLQQQRDDAIVSDLTKQLKNTQLAIQHLETSFSQKMLLDQQSIYLLQQQNKFLIRQEHALSIRELRTLQGHFEHESFLIQLEDGTFASRSRHNTIKIWDPKTGACLRTLIGPTYHIDIVVSRVLVALRDGTLASLAGDGIRIWDPQAGVCLQILQEDTSRFTALAALSDGTLASESTDRGVYSSSGTIRIWNPKTGECLRTLQGYTNAVSILTELKDGTLASGSNMYCDDGIIKIWNPQTGICFRTLIVEPACRVHTLIPLSDGTLASGCEDKTIKIWDPQAGVCLRTLQGHTDGVYALRELKGGALVSGSADKTIKIWDPQAGVCLRTLQLDDNVSALIVLRDGTLAIKDSGTKIKILG